MDAMFANEEAASSQAYPESYKLKGVTEQANRLREIFPGIGYENVVLAERPVPEVAEGNFVIPRWETVAQTYNEAVSKVLVLVGSTRRLHNYREGQFGPKHLRQSARTTDMFQKLGNRQKGHDLLVIPAQFGLRHRGRSVRRAREKFVFVGNEFGLGAFATGIMLLTHPARFERFEDLYVDCAGDEYAPGADGAFFGTPVWGIGDDGDLGFAADGLCNADPFHGSASAFLSE